MAMSMKELSSLLPSATSNRGNKTDDNNNLAVDNWTRFGKRQILSIGSKKRHLHHDDDDDDPVRRNDDSSSDEEDGGRTSAIKERKKKKSLRPPPPPAAIVSMIANAEHEVESASSRKKKKKKDKKERIKDSSSSSTIVNALTNINDAVNNNTKTNQVDDIDNNKNDATIIDAVDSSGINNNNNSTTKKRYKKKIRSRQKNIRKDHRSECDRPQHLSIPGGGARPLTHATKQKLGLLHPTTTPPPTANHDFAVPDSKSFVIDDNAFDSGEWIGNGDDDTTNQRKSDTDDSVHGKWGKSMSNVEFKQKKTNVRKATTTLTKVGDCIVDSSNNLTDNKAMVIKPMIGGKKGNSQKRKFKNIP
jgi:hypothetical protein